MDAECAEQAAKASNQEEHLTITESCTWSTAVEVGGLSISVESSCNSQCLGRVEGILCVVGKSLGANSLSHGFPWYGEATEKNCRSWVAGHVDKGPKARCVSFIGGHWRCQAAAEGLVDPTEHNRTWRQKNRAKRWGVGQGVFHCQFWRQLTEASKPIWCS